MLAEPFEAPSIGKDYASTLPDIIATIEKASQELEAYIKFTQLSTLLDPSSITAQTIARQSFAPIQNACEQMMNLIVDPRNTLQNIMYSHHSQAALRYVVDCNIAQFVPADGHCITFSELTSKSSTSPKKCARILRLLMTYNIFCEPTPGYVCHTPASLLLLDSDVHATIQYQTKDSFKASSQLTKALQKWPDSGEPNETAFNLAHDTSLSMFGYFSTKPEKLTRYRQAMAGMARRKQFDARHLVDGYPWETLPAATTVIDVGGATGHISLAIADQHPDLHVMCQDLGISPEAENSISSTSPIKFMHYDFFKPQSIQADIYLFRWILHDWSDEYAVKILRNQITAMRPGSRFLIMDGIMPSSGSGPRVNERAARVLDMAMMTLHNAFERELDDWKQLFKSVDSRLNLSRIFCPEGSALAIMEVVLGD